MSRLLPASLLALVASLPAQVSQVAFTDVTTAAGIDWQQQDFGDLVGAGGAFLDYDGDGWQDIFILGGVDSPILYRNQGDGSFVDVTTDAGLDLPPIPVNEWMAVAIGDYDNDGDPDMFICMHGPDALMRNNGNGTFSDVTPGFLIGSAWSTAPVFHDYDGDGWLDLYVGKYVAGLNFPNHIPLPNALYRNNQDGTFSDVTELCEVAGAGTTLAVYWTDVDMDGDPDLLVGNDFGEFIEPNLLYRNNGRAGEIPGDIEFDEVSAAQGARIPIYCMGIAAADIDHDQDFDYYFTNLGRNVLLRNDMSAGFKDVSAATGTELTHDPDSGAPPLFATHWGTGFRDFDLDGWDDLYVSAGYIPAASFINNGVFTANSLLMHEGRSLTFRDVSASSGIADRGMGRGAAFADYDNDGDVDILQLNMNGPALLFRNDSVNTGNWLKLHPRGTASNREGIGAKIFVDCSTDRLMREVNRGGSFVSSSELAVIFGLGADTVIERLRVEWPSGIANQLHYLPVNCSMPLVEPKVTAQAIEGRSWTARGGGLDVTVKVINHSDEVVDLLNFPELRVNGNRVWLGVGDEIFLQAKEERLVRFRLPLPGDRGGRDEAFTIKADFLWTFLDRSFGFDQFRTQVEIQR